MKELAITLAWNKDEGLGQIDGKDIYCVDNRMVFLDTHCSLRAAVHLKIEISTLDIRPTAN
jgi:hypothetical protein